MDKELILKDGMFYERSTTERCLGSQQKALGSLVANSAVAFGNMVLVTIPPVLYMGTMVDVGELNLTFTKNRRKGSTFISAELPFLTWCGVPNRQEDTCFIHPYHERDRDNFVATTWEPPRNLLPVVHAEYSNTRNCFLQAHVTITDMTSLDKTYIPPYPNVYEDGHVCLGEDMEEDQVSGRTPNMLKHFTEKFMVKFLESPMNSDLTIPKTSEFFKFFKTGGEWKSSTGHLEGDWWKDLRIKKVHNDSVLVATEGVLGHVVGQ